MAVSVRVHGDTPRKSVLQWLFVGLLLLVSTSLVLIFKESGDLEHLPADLKLVTSSDAKPVTEDVKPVTEDVKPVSDDLETASGDVESASFYLRRPATEEPVFSPDILELLRMGDMLNSSGVLYPDAMDQVDWSAQVSRSDLLHHGALQRACVSQGDSFIPPDFGLPDSSARPVTPTEASKDSGAAFIEILRKCAPVDLYVPIGLRGQGYCEDAAAYAKYLKARMMPRWVMELKYFDAALNRSVSYHELCPKTPMVFFNHYWDGLREEPDWPETKPLYLMPNIEMYELDATHYNKADVVLCKTAVCAQYVTKWLDQVGSTSNTRGTRVIYTRFTTSDIATNALVASGQQTADLPTNPLPQKSFSDLQFIHTAGTSTQKGTKVLLDCWLRRSDLPPLNVYMAEDTYHGWIRDKYDSQIQKSANIKVHLGKMDASSFGLLIAKSAFFLCTSLMEGYGHYINHARASGGLVVTTDVPPMNELVTPTSGVLVRATRTASEGHFLGGKSKRKDALRGVQGFEAFFQGRDVCQAVDTITHQLSEAEIKQHAGRARQHYFYDTAFFAMKMDELRETLSPNE